MCVSVTSLAKTPSRPKIHSEEPGLGYELDEAVAEANPYTGTQLHLEMADVPIVGETDI
jgi:hypothetical protein